MWWRCTYPTCREVLLPLPIPGVPRFSPLVELAPRDTVSTDGAALLAAGRETQVYSRWCQWTCVTNISLLHGVVSCEWICYISIVNQLDAQFFEFIEFHSTCLGRSFRPSSGVQFCTYRIKYMSYWNSKNGYNYYWVCMYKVVKYTEIPKMDKITYWVYMYKVVKCTEVPKMDKITYWVYIQSVTGGMCETSGECSLGQTIPI